MAADAIATCLSDVTDYAQFERFCSDLMVLEGYSNLEPIGGFKDKGRDAVHVSKSSGRTSIFAYSVREDWRKKLSEDAEKIRRHKHVCDELVFLCTEQFTGGERDKAIRDANSKYGLPLILYGLERISTLLRTRHRALIGQHPQLFPPSFFPPNYAGIDPTARDFVVVDYADADEVLATWLARRLMAAGFRPWCRSLSLLGGERVGDVVEGVIRNHACRVIAVYSESALRDPDVQYRRSVALGLRSERGANFFIPISVTPIERSTLDYQTRDLSFVAFERSWAFGVETLLNSLEAGSCPRPFENGSVLVSQTLIQPGLLKPAPEPLFSNCFGFKEIPETILSFKTAKTITAETAKKYADQWSFRKASDHRVLSFQDPPADVAEGLGTSKIGGSTWRHVRDIEGIYPKHLATELLRKSLAVMCAKKGLKRMGEFSPLCFPPDLVPKNSLIYVRPDGRTTRVIAVGERNVWRSGVKVPYRYHLAPRFLVRADLFGAHTAVLKVGVHVTGSRGETLNKRTAGARRRRMFKSWYNHEWFARTLAIASFLADGSKEISFGEGTAGRVVLNAVPFAWLAPMALDETLLEPVGDDEVEMLARQSGDANDDEDEFEEDEGTQNEKTEDSEGEGGDGG